MPKRKLVEKPHCGGKWSSAQKRSFIISALRRASSRWGPKYSALKAAKVAYGKYKCCQCGNIFGPKLMRVDHRTPVVGIEGFTTYDAFIERLFVEKDQYDAICKDCHSIKTKAENAARKMYKKEQMEHATMPQPEHIRQEQERRERRLLAKPPGGEESFP